MGFDIYAGTLTRYYANNWKTATQQWAEEQGYKVERITAEDNIPEEEQMSPAEIQQMVEQWRDYILQALSQPGQPPYESWTEDNESQYYTKKLDRDALGAMLMTAASNIFEEPIPMTITKNWAYTEHPLYQKMVQGAGQSWSLFQGVTYWLPIPDSFMLQCPLPTGEMVKVGTLGLLRAELEELNSLAWKEEYESEVLKWEETEGEQSKLVGESAGKLPGELQADAQYDTDSLARYTYSVLWKTIKFAGENHLPILLEI